MNRSGKRVDTGMTNTTHLKPGKTWKYDVLLTGRETTDFKGPKISNSPLED